MTSALALLIAASLLLVPAHAQRDPALQCTAAKIKAAAKKTNVKLKCHAKATEHGADVDPTCLAKAEAKFSETWARIEARGGCPPAAGEQEIETIVDNCVNDIVTESRPCGDVDGVCGGGCPVGRCFVFFDCNGAQQPCGCHSSTTTCPSTTSTSTTTSTTLP